MSTYYDRLIADATAFLLEHPLNFIQPEDAMREDLIGMQIYEAPLFAVADASDPLFAGLRQPQVVHPGYLLPEDWLPRATSVLSFFAPFTQRVRSTNIPMDLQGPSDEWLHGRREGEELLVLLRHHIKDRLLADGYGAVIPMHDERFEMLAPYASNWSERHTGYICGLGTFGMSKGLITAKGIAGRMGSIITAAQLPVTQRTYEGLYDHCIGCGACARRCPVQTIDTKASLHQAKQHPRCDAFLDEVRSRPPRGASAKIRYGCGKCQVGVPCEHRIPKGSR